MKLISSIFVVFIIFYTFNPIVFNLKFNSENQFLEKEVCCKNETIFSDSTKETNKEKSCCEDGVCNNPFLACSNILFVNKNSSILEFKTNDLQSNNFHFYSDKLISSYINKLWKPPNAI